VEKKAAGNTKVEGDPFVFWAERSSEIGEQGNRYMAIRKKVGTDRRDFPAGGGMVAYQSRGRIDEKNKRKTKWV